MSLSIYHKATTRSIRVVWLCEELGLPYRLISVDKDAAPSDVEEFRRLSIFEKVPVLVDGAIHLPESGAILQYLLEKCPDSPVNCKAGVPGRTRLLHWLHGAETLSFAASLVAQHAHLRPDELRIPQVAEEGRVMARKFFSALDKEVSSERYLVGSNFTAADIMVGYTLYISALMGLLTRAETPDLVDYYNLITGRESFSRTIRKCVPSDIRPLAVVV